MAIAQILLRNRTLEKRKLNTEDELVKNLLQGKNTMKQSVYLLLDKHFTIAYQDKTVIRKRIYKVKLHSVGFFFHLLLNVSTTRV
ncbi:hypothetical protein [Virgibacillus proomii]|uniref:hypothetical protein n=1 Tax=Virgibacillus proomii TaxID=84407 RepID=UPI001C113B0D|nr:hypothetical protein [Virgibacillus proomii]MBU5266446.1 hypothetical protein [Virgibacillus proomii]